MKKILILFLIGIMSYPISFKAENECSDWSMEYPNIENINIRTEERYLYYRLDEDNIEYKKYDPNSSKHVDLNDYTLEFSYKTYDEVIPSDHIVVTSTKIPIETAYEDVKYIVITNNGYEERELELLGISFQDARTDRDVNFYLVDMNDAIKEEDNENSFIINKDGYVKFALNETMMQGKFLQINFILMGHNTTRTKDFMVDYLDSSNNLNYTVHLQSNVGRNIAFNTYPDDKILWVSRVDVSEITEYTIMDKLYKYYDLVRTDIGYFTSLEGNYLKEEEPVTFYSYQIKEDNSLSNENGIGEESLETGSIDEAAYSSLDGGGEQTGVENKSENFIDNYTPQYEDTKLEEKDESKDTSKKEGDNKKEKTSSMNTKKYSDIIEPTYEYLDNYPLEINDNTDNYELFELDEELNSDAIDTDNLIAFKTDSNDKRKNSIFKVYGILSLSGVLLLLLFLLIYRALKKEKNI